MPRPLRRAPICSCVKSSTAVSSMVFDGGSEASNTRAFSMPDLFSASLRLILKARLYSYRPVSLISTYSERCGSRWCHQANPPPAATANATHAAISALRHLVFAKNIALFPVTGIIYEKRFRGVRVETVNGAVPPLVLQHHHRRFMCAKQAKYTGRVLLGIVQDDERIFAFGRRVQPQHQAVSSRAIEEEERWTAISRHRELCAQFAACVDQPDPARGDDVLLQRRSGQPTRYHSAAAVQMSQDISPKKSADKPGQHACKVSIFHGL